MRRQQSIWGQVARFGVATAMLGLVAAPTVQAGIEPLNPQLSVIGGTGIPGGTVSVTVALADDIDGAGVSAGVDLRFDADVLEFSNFAASCKLANRLTSTHQIAGRLVSPNVLNIEIAIQVGPPPPPALGDGNLATCAFAIKAGVATGTSALEIASPFLGDADGGDIPVDVVDGFVTIVSVLPSPTPTVTSTPANTTTATVTGTPVSTVTATATATTPGTGTPLATPTVTNTSTTVTATSTATVTNTVPLSTTPTATATNTSVVPPTTTATATRTNGTPTATPKKKNDSDDGCNIVSPQQSDPTGAASLVLLPALLLWVRRRR